MNEPTDIVTRLRLTPVLMYGDEFNQNRIDYEACKKYINNEGVKMMREAADEIERLHKELETLHQHIKDIKEGFEGCCNACEPVGEMNKKLREERDEARRLVCRHTKKTYRTLREMAEERGWDCYKENTNG